MRTPEQKAKQNAGKRRRRAARNPEQRAADTVAQRDRRVVLTPEQKVAKRAADAARYAALTPEQRDAWVARNAAWHTARTPEQKKVRVARDGALRTARVAAFDFFVRRAHNLARRGIPADEMRAIWERQGGLCAITGRPLRQDGSSELDHIVPLAEGGSAEASNRQWVCQAANRLKGNLSDPEFVRFCIEVATYHKDNLLTPLSYNGTVGVWMSSLTAPV